MAYWLMLASLETMDSNTGELSPDSEFQLRGVLWARKKRAFSI